MKHDLAYNHRFDHVNLTLMPGDESRRNWLWNRLTRLKKQEWKVNSLDPTNCHDRNKYEYIYWTKICLVLSVSLQLRIKYVFLDKVLKFDSSLDHSFKAKKLHARLFGIKDVRWALCWRLPVWNIRWAPLLESVFVKPGFGKMQLFQT